MLLILATINAGATSTPLRVFYFMKQIYFQYYPANIKDTKPIDYCSLTQFLNSVKKPKLQTKEIFEQIKLADERKDQAEKQRLKSKLYYFTPCVTVSDKRDYKSITGFTGLLTLDFDKLDENYAKDFKKALFDEHDFIIAAWLSASVRGVRAFVSIPICKTIDEFKQYFMALEFDLGIYKGFDLAPKNCVLPMFMSYDKDILIRENYSTWSRRHVPIEIPKQVKYFSDCKDESKHVVNVVTKAIDKIVDNGHPQLRAAAFALGGYVGAGLIDSDFARNLIYKLIDENFYLKQKHTIYKKTADTMINKGINQPLNF